MAVTRPKWSPKRATNLCSSTIATTYLLQKIFSDKCFLPQSKFCNHHKTTKIPKVTYILKWELSIQTTQVWYSHEQQAFRPTRGIPNSAHKVWLECLEGDLMRNIDSFNNVGVVSRLHYVHYLS